MLPNSWSSRVTVWLSARFARISVPCPASGARQNPDGPVDPMSLELKTEDGRKVSLAQIGTHGDALRAAGHQALQPPAIHLPSRPIWPGAQPNDVTNAIWENLVKPASLTAASYRIDIGGSGGGRSNRARPMRRSRN